MKRFWILICMALMSICSCTTNPVNPTHLPEVADNYTGSWKMYDSLFMNGDTITSEHDFFIEKEDNNKLLMLAFPYNGDSIRIAINGNTVSMTYYNITYPLYGIGFYTFDTSRLEYMFEGYVAYYQYHRGYALKQ